MSQPDGKSFVAVIDAKTLRRASIASLIEAWANSENLQLTSFGPDQAIEAIHADAKFRMLIFSIGGESVAKNLQQLKTLRALASDAPLVVISDRENPDDVAAVFDTDAQGYLNSGISPALAFRALTFILNGGSYCPPFAVHESLNRVEADKPRGDPSDESESKRKKSAQNENGNSAGLGDVRDADMECQSANLTARQREVLQHLRLGQSNKIIARRLGMTEGTVKVHIRQMMRKCRAANRTQLALGGPHAAQSVSIAGKDLSVIKAVPQVGAPSLPSKPPEYPMPPIPLRSFA